MSQESKFEQVQAGKSGRWFQVTCYMGTPLWTDKQTRLKTLPSCKSRMRVVMTLEPQFQLDIWRNGSIPLPPSPTSLLYISLISSQGGELLRGWRRTGWMVMGSVVTPVVRGEYVRYVRLGHQGNHGHSSPSPSPDPGRASSPAPRPSGPLTSLSRGPRSRTIHIAHPHFVPWLYPRPPTLVMFSNTSLLP